MAVKLNVPSRETARRLSSDLETDKRLTKFCYKRLLALSWQYPG